MYVGTSFLSQHLGGYLWWRWAEPFEFVTMDIFRAGVYVEDAWVTDENLDRDLKEWDQGTFTYRGVQFELAWMNSEDSDHFRRAHDL